MNVDAADRRDLTGRVAIVTGSSRGIGRAIALELARRGAHVAVNARKGGAALAGVVDDIQAIGGTAIAAPFDVAERAEVEEAVTKIETEFGPTTLLVNNAALDRTLDYESIDEDEWDRVLNANTKGVHNCIQATLAGMKAARGGSIVCITSIAAKRGSLFGNAHYAASKSAIHGLVRTLARYLAPHAIRVNAIAPGPIETELFRQNIGPEQRKQVLSRVPLGVMGAPEDVAYAAAFLASPEARFITGETLNVNGGSYMD